VTSCPKQDRLPTGAAAPGDRLRRGPAAAKVARRLRAALLVWLVACFAIWVAVPLAPLQVVKVEGQSARVGVLRPQPRLSGPGELDLFGEPLTTKARFDGPFRPRLELPLIVPDKEMAALAAPNALRDLRGHVSRALAWGWARYFGIESGIAVGCATVLLVALMGWRGAPRRTIGAWVLAGALTTTGINATGALVDLRGAAAALRHVHSLDDLVGSTAAVAAVPTVQAASSRGAQVVVLGDSVAAGAGNASVASPSRLDTACGRSSASFAAVLGRVAHWSVDNLACSGATVEQGVLQTQHVDSVQVPPQLLSVLRFPRARAIIVNIGANDVQWGALLQLCSASPRCDDRASTAYFHQGLALLTEHLTSALGRMAAIPGRPRVVVNEYYDPFGGDTSCLSGMGLTPQKVRVLKVRLEALNQTLGDSASAFGLATAVPDFTGHQLCTARPDVQGPGAPAPFHPTPGGEALIAMADQRALR
jgi:lysophospholipase L1-like esterase